MLASETKVFLQFPNESPKRILHPATIKEAGGSSCTAEMEETNVAIEAGQKLFVYYNDKRRFVKVAARIDAVMQTAPRLVVGFQTIGEPVGAESREWFRVSTLMANLNATVGRETECPLLDVSNVGFSIEATQRYQAGDVVPVTLRYEGQQFCGDGIVQSVRDLGEGRFRYGFRSVDEKGAGGGLQKGQQFISAAIEREQLRRLSRSG
jgi:hypothetical protein